MVNMLQGVIERGTAVAARVLGRPLAGKTGTTNESKDAWFVGFSPDLVVGVFVGFDQPASLGPRETGASVALPIWIEFMRGALDGTPPTPFRTPPGILLVQVDAETGRRSRNQGRHLGSLPARHRARCGPARRARIVRAGRSRGGGSAAGGRAEPRRPLLTRAAVSPTPPADCEPSNGSSPMRAELAQHVEPIRHGLAVLRRHL
jgi:penicillin-binding protein 1A